MAPFLRYPSSGWAFYQTTWQPNFQVFGAGSFLFGTAVSSAMALLFGAPIAIAIALFLSLLAPAGVRGIISPLVEMLAAIPSVILGFWGILVLAPFVHEHLEPFLHNTLGFIPIFGAPQTTGASIFTAGLILTIMVIPIIASISRDLFLTVPREIQDGASALGATRWEVVRGVVLPSTASGVVAATLLGLGRALGEAIAVTQVIGAGSAIHASLFKTGDTLAARIANQFQEASPGIYRASLFYLGVILLAIGLISNLCAQWIGRRFDIAQGERLDERARRSNAGGEGDTASARFDPTAPLTPSGNLRRRQLVSHLAVSGATFAAMAAVAVLGIVIYSVLVAWGSALSFEFLTKGAPNGIGPAIVGTALIVALATAIAMPLGILVALYLTEFAGDRAARSIRLALDLMNGLPSIIIGLFIFGLLVNHQHQSAYAGSIALAIIMLPLIARGSQEILLLVPSSLREAADALGVSRWRTVLGVILPSALGGIVTSTVLAVARAAGETAPLLLPYSIVNNATTASTSAKRCRTFR